MSENNYISIKGTRVNNLKNIGVDIPRNRLVVITGLSGSGKSSLAFDTLYAEGQRRYVESLSSYACQFLGRISKLEYDFIKGVPPAIAIEQKVNGRNPCSTVGTSTEVYECLRLLYSRVGKTYSPISGQEVKKHSTEDIVNCMLSYPKGTRYTVLIPIRLREGRALQQQPETGLKQRFNHIKVNGEMKRIDEYTPVVGDEVYLLVDRMVVANSKDAISRLTDSAEAAMYEGDGTCILRFYLSDGTTKLHTFSAKLEVDGIVFEESNDQMFSFNSPIGACPVYEGFGKVINIDEHSIIPDRSLSVYEGVIVYWRGEKMGEWKKELIHNAEKFDFPIFAPYYKLIDAQRRLLWEGNQYFHGINDFFKMLEENQYKTQYRVILARYRGKILCLKCRGTRLKPEAGYARAGGKNISELVDLPITELKEFFDHLELGEHDSNASRRILVEINSRIRFLADVGLDYLTLNWLNNSLSGEENQCIDLATSLGSSLVGSLYILDEPDIGLHSRDTNRLLHVLRQLQQLDNTIIVVERDEEIIRAAGYIIDIGPNIGRLGGKVVYQGDMKDLKKGSNSYTVRYLLGEDEIPVPKRRRLQNNYIELKGAHENNLKGVNVRIPLNVMTVVTDVSGSGKNTLVRDIFFRALKRELGECSDRPGEFSSIGRSLRDLRNVEFVDRDPIGKSSRSNPVTYIKAYDEIRKLWSERPLAKQVGYTPGFFSFSSEGGRREECKGGGIITVEMQFMADLVLEYESCHGKRFKSDTLEVKFNDKSIYDVLEMTANQTVEFFNEHGQRKTVKKLFPLQDVGLGYIKSGQSSSTLSGGENQRIKPAFYLSQEKADPTMFIFDEPTTGLHFHDVRKLLDVFDALIRRGHSIVITEHNTNVIKRVSYVTDLGPGGGDKGGNIIAVGTPEEVAACGTSYTGQFLKEKLGQNNKLSEVCYIFTHA